jgi:hypothetical protein
MKSGAGVFAIHPQKKQRAADRSRPSIALSLAGAYYAT